jgi:hypothetical protein
MRSGSCTLRRMSISLGMGAAEQVALIPVGTSVDVKNRYIGTWSSGFEIAGLGEEGYLIRRLSDGSVLPDVLAFDEIRPL